MKLERVDARYDGNATYHDSCSGLRELGVKAQPRRLLASVEGLTLTEMRDAEICCGFGGTFCSQIRRHLRARSRREMRRYRSHRRRTLLAGDLGCLLNMAGKLKRRGRKTRCATSPRCWPA